jgi:hypothetical protein
LATPLVEETCYVALLRVSAQLVGDFTLLLHVLVELALFEGFSFSARSPSAGALW